MPRMLNGGIFQCRIFIITVSKSTNICNKYIYQILVVQLISHVWLFATPWSEACQAPLSMGFPRQEYCSGLPFPSPGDLPNTGLKPMSPALAGRFLTNRLTWEAHMPFRLHKNPTTKLAAIPMTKPRQRLIKQSKIKEWIRHGAGIKT